MSEWIIKENEYEENRITLEENKFLVGNGYLGIRGALEEYGKDKLPAINLAGIYDRVGDGWREPLNAPNGLFTRLKVDQEYFCLPERIPEKHARTLDFRHGIVRRETEWRVKRGKISVFTEYFADVENPHLICTKYVVTTDFHADVEIITGIDGDVWDIHGPHYDEISFQMNENRIYADAVTHEKRDHVAVAAEVTTDACYEKKEKREDRQGSFRICYVADVEEPVTVWKKVIIYTSNDVKNPMQETGKVLDSLEEAVYETLMEQQISAWEKYWAVSEVRVEGDREAERAVNYSLYHLMSIAPRHTGSLSIPARGLSGQTYKGAVFWDTEMFMLDFFLNTNPEVAKTLLRYRIDTLCGARKKALEYGYQGAFYAWESQENGFDACSDYNVTDVFTGRPMRTFFKDKQVHISAAVVYGIMHYVQMTGDVALLEQGGRETVIECARFYDSLLIKKVHSDSYEIRDVIGPDEYHERVDNNGYTNRMAKFVFEAAVKLLKKDDDKRLMEVFSEDAEKIYIPKQGKDGVVEQFDHYFTLEDTSVEAVKNRLLNEKEYWGGAYGVASQTQIIKQADVVTWMTLFPDDFDRETKWKNWEYYEKRTEHGSSLSACMYGILACLCGRPEAAYQFLLKSAEADLKGGGKEWAGSVYIGGTHPAAAGGVYMMLVKGFAGLKVSDGKLKCTPCLPKTWRALEFRMWFKKELYDIRITGGTAEIRKAEPCQSI